jgi:hypothetical protein
MQSLLGRCATLYNPTRIHPVLNSLADECCGMLARLVVYVGALALLAIVGIHLWDQLPPGEAAEASAKAAWSVATRSHPAFAVSQFDLAEKTETYEILRHPGGGRKDIMRWDAGWTCRGDSLPARRSAIGCILSRLILLTAGNDPKLAELFARAELKRGSCTASAASADWVTGAENPRLRGTF